MAVAVFVPYEGLGGALLRGDLDIMNGEVAGEDALHLFGGDKKGV